MNVNLDTTLGIPYTGSNIADNKNMNETPIDTNTPIDTTNYMSNNTILIVLIVIVIGYYVIFSSLGSSNNNDSFSLMGDSKPENSKTTTLEILLWGVFLTLILLNGLSYFFNFNVSASLKNLFSDKPTVDLIVDPDNILGESSEYGEGVSTSVPELTFKKQVFHIPNNKYTYDDAKAICRAYGGRLATYNEVEEAYENGGDWCGYGWSDGQMALFPTQFEKWQTLQKIKGHEHDCGRPGVNGGYIDNPAVKFGINCYGYKPKITQEEAERMAGTSLYPKTQKELDFEKRVRNWKDKLPDILVAPFNHTNWSSY